jgi:hypothetical protein
MRSMMELELFRLMDSKSGLVKTMQSVNTTADAVTDGLLDDALATIKRRLSFALKERVLSDLNSGRTLLIYNPTKIQLTTAIPAFLRREPSTGNAQAVVNLGAFTTKNREGQFTIEPRVLFGLLQAGTILLGSYENWNKLTMDSDVLKSASKAYSQMFCQVLDRMYGINLQALKSDIIHYSVAKFFLLYVLGKSDNDTTESLAMNCATHGTTKNTLSAAGAQISDDAYRSLPGFFAELSHIDGLQGLSFVGFMENYAKMYGDGAVYSVEFFPTLVHTLAGALAGSRITRDYQVEQVAGNVSPDVYNAVTRILR